MEIPPNSEYNSEASKTLNEIISAGYVPGKPDIKYLSEFVKKRIIRLDNEDVKFVASLHMDWCRFVWLLFCVDDVEEIMELNRYNPGSIMKLVMVEVVEIVSKQKSITKVVDLLNSLRRIEGGRLRRRIED